MLFSCIPYPIDIEYYEKLLFSEAARLFNRFSNFMAGRNGMDALNLTLLGAAVVFSALGVFAHSQAGYNVMRVVSTVLIVAAIWRMFSRRVDKRQLENQRFLSLTAPLRTGFANLFGRLRGDRTHKFFTCPNCRNRLRVPAGKGRIAITCPKCGNRFEGKS